MTAEAVSAARFETDKRYHQAIEVVLICCLVVAPVLLASRAPWAWAIDGIIVSLAVGLWLLRASAKGALKIRQTPLDLPILALLLLAALSTITSIYRYASVTETVRLASYILLYYVIVNNVDGRAAVRRMLRSVVILGTVLSAYGLYEVMSGSEQVLWTSKALSWGIVSGTFRDGATFGGFLTLLVPLAGSAVLDGLSRRRWQQAGFYGICAAVMVAALIGTLNRSSWLGTTVALGLMGVIALCQSPARTEYKLGLIAGALALALMLAGTVSRPVIDRFRSAFADVAGRYEYVLSSLAMMRDRPLLGFGAGTFEYAWRAYRLPTRASVSKDAVYAHNEYAQLGAEMGVLAPLCAVWLIAAHVRSGFRSIHGAAADWTAAGLAAAPAGLAAANITYFHWHVPATAFLFWAILGLARVWHAQEVLR